MISTEVLKDEHRVIERMINLLKVASEKLNSGEDVSAEIFRKSIDFIRTFADKCHHGKEENILFNEMESRGMPREGGPIGIMLMEHDEGRRFVKGLAEAIEKYEKYNKDAQNEIIRNALGYAELLTQHIFKEDNILYPMADQMFSNEDQKELIERFDKVEQEMGEGIHHKYVELVEKLEKELGI